MQTININKWINDKIVSVFLKNFDWISSKDFVAPYNTYKEKWAICSCCNGESGQESCCNAKEKNCTASSSNSKRSGLYFSFTTDFSNY